MRVSDPGYKGIRSGVRGYQIRGTWVSDPGYKGIRSRVRGFQIRGMRVSVSTVTDLGYVGIGKRYVV